MQLTFEVIGIYTPAPESPMLASHWSANDREGWDSRANESYASNNARETGEFINIVDICL
jgi:hypothetical protein